MSSPESARRDFGQFPVFPAAEPDLVLVRKDQWDASRGDNCLLKDEVERLRDRAKRLKAANDGNHHRAVNAERAVVRLRLRHDEKNAEAHAKHTQLVLLIDALSDDLAYEISRSPDVKRVVRESLVLMDDARCQPYLDAWWLKEQE